MNVFIPVKFGLDTPKKAYRAAEDAKDFASDVFSERSARDARVRDTKKAWKRAKKDYGSGSW